MKRMFYVVNETGGYFLSNEEELCKTYCRDNGYTYRIEFFDPGY